MIDSKEIFSQEGLGEKCLNFGLDVFKKPSPFLPLQSTFRNNLMTMIFSYIESKH